MKNICAFTVIIGGYDELRPPLVVNDHVDYVCYTDAPIIQIAPWQIRFASRPFSNPRRHSRMYKIHSHMYFPDADYTLYHDGNIRLKIDPVEAFDKWLVNHDMAVLTHPHRSCVYEEAECCLEGGPDYEPGRIGVQMKKYRVQDYPEKNGLAACSLILRRHTRAIRDFNEAWWREVRDYSVRDQLSFNYAAWKLGVEYDVIPGDLFEHEDFDYLDHVTLQDLKEGG